MKEFILINKTKFFLLLRVTIIFTLGMGFISLLGQHEKSNIILVFPFMTQLLIHLYDFVEFQRMNKILNSQPFIRLTEIGLKKTYSDKTIKLISPKPILQGYVDNFPIKCEVENGILRITADINRDLTENSQKEKLISVFGKENVQYDLLGIGLIYDSLRQKRISFKDLIYELRQFIEIIKTEDLNNYDTKA